jgi:peptide/nickel transport system permease protein
MTRFLLRRLAHLLPVALLVATLVFSLLHLVPGDPIEMMLGDGAQAGDIVALRQRLGLDRPLGAQYGSFLAGLARGDLGVSIHSGEPVTRVIARHYPATLQLAVASLVVALVIALPLGVAAAVRRGGWVDHLSRWLALVGVSLPGFWLGPMLILLFAVHWGALPVSGRAGPASLVLPALTLGAALAGLLTRMVRAALAEELAKPYVVAARGKGLTPGRVVARHALKNALVPVITVVGLQFGNLLTGAIIAETIFSWPGLGRLLIQSIRLRDYPLVQGGVLAMAVTYVLVNLATDVAYAWVDPRIRLEAAD